MTLMIFCQKSPNGHKLQFGSLKISHRTYTLINFRACSPSNYNAVKSLRKHAYSNLLKISPPKTEYFSDKILIFFHISAQNIDCAYSLEPPGRGGSMFPRTISTFWHFIDFTRAVLFTLCFLGIIKQFCLLVPISHYSRTSMARISLGS